MSRCNSGADGIVRMKEGLSFAPYTASKALYQDKGLRATHARIFGACGCCVPALTCPERNFTFGFFFPSVRPAAFARESLREVAEYLTLPHCVEDLSMDLQGLLVAARGLAPKKKIFGAFCY